MGHFYTTVTGKGTNRKEAQDDAIYGFISENGNRHDVREVSKAKHIETVPPMGVIYNKNGVEYHDFTQPRLDAPKSEWLEVWEFELHTHA